MVNAAAIAVPVGVVCGLAALAVVVIWVLRRRHNIASDQASLPTSTLTKPASSKHAMILDSGSHLPAYETSARPSNQTSTRAVYDCIVTTGQSTISEAAGAQCTASGGALAYAIPIDSEVYDSQDLGSAPGGHGRGDRHYPAAEDILKTMSSEKMSLQTTQVIQKQCCPICHEVIAMGHTIAWLPCEHVFHHKCIGQWLNSCRSCPSCHIVLTTHTLEDVVQEGQWHHVRSSDRR
ncbi:hypothetical protein WJX73_002504 [Symbiochloris irregularis]|uniref:RING-type domain-containing protein n=1 Tax=Symbiochloris irregularis TaxID=706552 RepID=A0AAW1NR62_9CHLO